MDYDFLRKSETSVSKRKKIILLGIILIFIILAWFLYQSSNTSITTLKNTLVLAEMGAGTKINDKDYVLTIGEESPLFFNLTPPGNYWNAKILVTIPKGLELLKGNTTWEGNLIGGKTKTLNFYVRAVKVGKWEVKLSLKDFKDKVVQEKSFYVCVDVLKKDAIKRCVS